TGFGKEITMRDLVSTYVFTNTLVVKQITGSVLRAYLEKTSLYWTLSAEGGIIVSEDFIGPSEAHFNYDMVDGVEYTIRVSNPPGERITELTRNGKPVRDDDVFTLVINNYRAAGGGEYDMLSSAKTVSENLTDMVELLANDILKNGEIDFEPADNIRVVV
ncbi:MAG: 5'-nucleotidase C-terminal domain-containing protein, partial [Butyrivibrio sp.]|nr:5'-nucleotidase C-terminal domain-containing protein [Butyrivibrio sp.]